MQNTGIKEKELLQQFFQDKRVKKLQQTISELRKNENEKFNIFKILKLDKYEIRHSNFLAWLLNPKGSHNLGDTFFKQFFQVALNENVEDITTSDIRIETEHPANVEDTTRRIDILIYSVQTPEFVCVIENKYGTEEHTGQCQAYKTFIEKYSKFRNYSRKIYIFLDLNVPTDEQLDKKLQGYKPITYRDIFYILSEMQQNLGQYNYTGETIKQYTEIIKENYTMIDKEIKKQYRIIYDTYKEVFDIFEEYQKEFLNDIFEIMKSVVGCKTIKLKMLEKEPLINYIDKNKISCGVRFVPDEIDIPESNNLSYLFPFFFLEYNKELTLSICTTFDFKKCTLEGEIITIDIKNKSNEEIQNAILDAIDSLKDRILSIYKVSKINIKN